MLWCVNPKCDQAITRISGQREVVCLKCKASACFNCQKPWHGDNICGNNEAIGFWSYLCRKGVRKCPKCRVRIEKDGGCPHMKCPRCHVDFCWCCMGESENHNKFYSLCPRLPFNLCVNILLVILGIIFMPLIFTLGPLGYAFYGVGYSIVVLYECFRLRRRSRAVKIIGTIFAVVIALGICLPVCLALAGLASALLLSFGTIAGVYYGLVYIGRVVYYLIAI